GRVDPANALVPFGRFDTVHFARLLVLEDETLGDLEAYGAAFDAPVYLLFLGDCDGPAETMLDALAREAEAGLRRIFAHCQGFSPGADLRRWMDAHAVRPATAYVNWIGRTVRQVREEAALHDTLSARREPGAAGESARAARERLKAAVLAESPAPTPLPATPLRWRLADAADAVGGVLVLLIAAPLLAVYAPVFLAILRSRETRDPVIAPPADLAKMRAIGAADDHDVSNAFSAVGSLKPGWFRLSTVSFILWFLNWANRHIFRRGRLARVGTIHFARWVFLDGKRRMVFASNYDGALDSYMDDFINKAGYGLNLVFSNGAGYPRTRFLVLDGAQDEQAFKFFLRRHQLPTDVWYKAYPGLTAFDLARNAEIRRGFERRSMTDGEAARWLALI
ncbi:MAG: hypothetical protein H0X27_08130, partial [Caulobacteraceae bacterium]|nr:hypothetical protein [Caulobacteraceae bacterium]